ncbi:MAG: hypothetical protein ACRBCI_15120 [Cellvibrionaceae bacterium]
MSTSLPFIRTLVHLTPVLLLSFIVSSCTQTQHTQPPSINITVSEPDRIRFSGKGAGAGMMLMGAMGSMGIAIGVAIDEGIAKEIDENAKQAGFDIQQLTHKAFSHGWKNSSSISPLTIHIKHYGFKLIPGKNDPVSPELQLIVSTPQGKKIHIQYPDNEIPQLKALSTEPLETVKKEGELTIKLYQEALKAISVYAVSNIH